MWSTDYPHSDSTWPKSREVLTEHFKDVPAEERRLIAGGNAARLYGLSLTMTDVLAGVRVVEVADWGFVPSAATVLGDWGAEVVKIEHPTLGDPIRGLVTSGLIPGASGRNFFVEHLGRNKRSVGHRPRASPRAARCSTGSSPAPTSSSPASSTTRASACASPGTT